MEQKNLRSAIILAAGMGTRLDPPNRQKPKGFIQFGEQPIVERSIQQLISLGIECIVIVTGYHAEYYDALCERYPCIRTVRNDQYATSGSMYSLYLARGLVDETILLLESDLIYETRALDVLLATQKPNAILLSGFTGSGDECWVEAKDLRLCKVAKSKSILRNVAGEMVGISKISPILFKAMVKHAEVYFRSDLGLAYEICISQVAEDTEIFVCKIDDLVWTEIDDEFHLLRAQREIYPQIIALERRSRRDT